MQKEVGYSNKKVFIRKLLLCSFFVFLFLLNILVIFFKGFSSMLVLTGLFFSIFGFFCFFILSNFKSYHLVAGSDEMVIGNEIVKINNIVEYRKIFQDKRVLFVKYAINSQLKNAILVSPEKVKSNSFYPTRFKSSFVSLLETLLIECQKKTVIESNEKGE